MKTFLLVAALCAVAVSGNPAINTEWHWKLRTPIITPNALAMPYGVLVDSYVKEPRIPGTMKVAGCGPVKATSNERIVGGYEAVPHSFPWQAALFIDNSYFCGGSIISSQYILTAGHCLYGAKQVKAVLGAHNLQQQESTQMTYYSMYLTVHAGYNPNLLTNDIALVWLPTPITFSAAIAPVCLPSYSSLELPPNTRVTPTGWGYRYDGATAISDVLMRVDNYVISNADCAAVHGAFVTDGTICTSTVGGHGTCSGDSGGPLNYVKGGRSYTGGITSYVSSYGCEAGYPDGFIRVTSFLDWIETKTGIIIDP